MQLQRPRGWEEEPRRCRLWPSANPADAGTKSRRYFTSLGWDLAVLQSPGQRSTASISPGPGECAGSPLCSCPQVTEAFLSCVCWLLHHPAFTSFASMESWSVPNGKGPTRISEIQLLALHRTAQQSHCSLSVVPTLVGLCQTWGCEHSLGSLDREILTAGFQNPSAVWREDESVLRIGVVM